MIYGSNAWGLRQIIVDFGKKFAYRCSVRIAIPHLQDVLGEL
jgi:hypothetical protein